MVHAQAGEIEQDADPKEQKYLLASRLLGRLIVAELLARAPDFGADEAAGYRAVSEFQCGWMRLPLTVASRCWGLWATAYSDKIKIKIKIK